MVSILKKIFSKFPFIYALWKSFKTLLQDLRIIPAFLQERRIKRQGPPIKVGFLCQYIPAWTKTEDLYCRMKKDDRFEPYLICVPDRITNNQLDSSECMKNDTYDYCITHGYPEAINALIGKDTWLDLKTMDLAYIFHARPYNHLLPASYTTRHVSRYSRVCLIMYGIGFSSDLARVSLNRNFMAYTYYYFAGLPFMRTLNMKNNRRLHRLNLQKTECYGYPMLEHLKSFKNAASPSWEFSESDFRVLWTPRWTTDKALGGSNFFTYHEELLTYAAAHPEVDFLFRPHPLMFSHFIETGELTEEEAADYISRCDALPNVSLDKELGYEATFWNASVLVSDISSIMVEFFITGKPIIFCASNMALDLSEGMKRMLEGCYIAHNKQELFAHLQALKDGQDPLKELREKIMQEQFVEDGSSPCANIMDALARDFNERA